MNLFIIADNSLRAQNTSGNFYFDHITTENGLSSNDISCLYRDRRGFLWIGTHNGLNEYDGRNVTAFYHNRFNPHSIVSNDILSITEDDSGYLWIGSNGGISRFNPFDQQSVNYYHQPNEPFSLNDNKNCRVYIDKEKNIWIGNESGLSLFDKKTKHFIPITILPDSLNKRRLTSVSSFLEDKNGRFWLGTYSGLVLYDRKKHNAQRFIFNKRDKKGENIITTLFLDHAGHIWAGTWGSGFGKFDPVQHIFHLYKWNKKNTYAGTTNIIFCMSQSRSVQGKYIVWAGSSEGLLKVDSFPLADNFVTHILPDGSNSHALSSASISCMLTDNENILWLGTNNGLNEYARQNQLFSNTFSFNGSVTKICVDSFYKPSHFYVATWYGNGLTETDHNFRPLHNWNRIPPSENNMNNGQVSDVIYARNGTLWIATFNGLYNYDKKHNQFTPYLHQANNKNSMTGDRITCLLQDDEGLIWIGTYGRGLNIYDPVKKIFTHFLHNNTDMRSLAGNLIWNIYQDRYHRIWIATNDGLSLFNKKNKNFNNYVDDENNANSLKGTVVSGLVADTNNIYWIATEKGLNRFNFKTQQFTLYASEEGLKNNNISALALDHNGQLWMCTGSGISRFYPLTKTFINYDEQHGLPQGVMGPLITESNGDIVAGGDNVILTFNPDNFKTVSAAPSVYITRIAVGGRVQKFDHAVSQSGPLILHYPKNTLSVSFTAPEFFNGKAVKYAYRLDGADARWVYAGTQNFVTYSNLPAAHYVLHIKAANSDGVWNEAGMQMQIIVLPPFWKTWWFRAALLLFIILCIYFLFTYRVRNIRRQEALKTALNKQMADMRLKALRSRMNPHFMFNALNSIQECIYTGQTNSAYRYLSKFSKLVRMILERSEQSFISISQEIELLQLYLELESLRFQQTFTYDIDYDKLETDFLKIPPMLVQPFVENAIWHGLLHKEGEKKLDIIFRADDDFIYVTIQDNGVGRDAARAGKIKTIKEQQSLGIRLVTEQLQMVNHLKKPASHSKKQPPNIAVEDLFTENNSHEKNKIPAGTKIILTIPIVKENEEEQNAGIL